MITDWYVNHRPGRDLAFTDGKVFVTQMFAGHINIYSPDGAPGIVLERRGHVCRGETRLPTAPGCSTSATAGPSQLRCFNTRGSAAVDALGPGVAGCRSGMSELFSVAQAPDGTLFVGDFSQPYNVLIFAALAHGDGLRNTFRASGPATGAIRDRTGGPALAAQLRQIPEARHVGGEERTSA